MVDYDDDNMEAEMDVNPETRLRLVEAINSLDKTQHIKNTTRDGLSEVKSAFHVSSQSKTIRIKDIIKTLENSKEHTAVKKKLVTARKSARVLSKPLEKYKAEKIKRATGFEEVKNRLNRWEAVVTKNRASDLLKFPHEKNEKSKQPIKEYLAKFSLKSELEVKLESLQPAEEERVVEQFPLSMEEMLEARREAARLRAKQSYKEAKARRQNKIKSKKFHRIQRKERIRKELKDFEVLQKTDPEEALKKLEQLEKTRAQERVSLRHRSTGQWAKNKLVRAKYDKETRQQLSQQLSISKELTQKIAPVESESENEQENTNVPVTEEDLMNPWFIESKAEDIEPEFGNYRKYWNDKNKMESEKPDDEEIDLSTIPKTVTEESNEMEKEDIKVIPEVEAKKPKRKRASKRKVTQSTTEWNIEDVQGNGGIKKSDVVASMFDELENDIECKVAEKLSALKKIAATNSRKMYEEKLNVDSEVVSSGLEFKRRITKPVLDEELNETAGNVNKQKNNRIMNLNLPLKDAKITKPSASTDNKIDPDKFVGIKPTHLFSALPDMDDEGDHLDDDEDNKKLTIAEAFQDDDIIEDFQQEKSEDINKNKIQIDDAIVPGWGSWTGKNLAAPKRRRRKLFNVPKVLPRKDDTKHNVIISESKLSKLRAHQVSELPFPFTSVEDFEATVRAPIGNTFVPESAHRKLIKPSVSVKTGVVIEPMGEDQLVNKKPQAKNSKLKMFKK